MQRERESYRLYENESQVKLSKKNSLKFSTIFKFNTEFALPHVALCTTNGLDYASDIFHIERENKYFLFFRNRSLVEPVSGNLKHIPTLIIVDFSDSMSELGKQIISTIYCSQ